MKTKRKVLPENRVLLYNRLLKHGNNPDTINNMLDAHYEYVNKHCTSIAMMAEVIICL